MKFDVISPQRLKPLHHLNKAPWPKPRPSESVRKQILLALGLCLLTAPIMHAQSDDRPHFGGQQPANAQAEPPKPQREENIVVTQPKPGEAIDQEKARAVLNAMFNALGGNTWLHRGDYILEGRTSSFYKGQPTGVADYIQFHHVFPDGTYADRIELTKKRDIVQMWTASEGVEVTYKGRKPLPKEQQQEYFRRQHYTLDAIANVWLKDPDTLLIYGGTKVVARREVEEVTLVDKENDSVDIDVEKGTHLPLRRIYKTRNPLYKDFDEDMEEYSDFHDVNGVPTAYVTTRYFNGDMVAQRFIEKMEYKAVDPALYQPNAPLGKHKY